MKRIIVLLLTLGLIFTLCPIVNADEEPNETQIASEYISDGMLENFEAEGESLPTATQPSEINITSKSVILMDAATGTVLYEKEPDTQRAPASITKVMTLILTMEAISDGTVQLTDRIVASRHAASMGGSQIWLKEGEAMTVDEILKAVTVASANDASVALGEHLAGSEELFVGMMNEKAKKMGLENTCFVNCCGLDAPGHYSSARDIAKMSRELLKYDLIRNYTSIWMDYLRNGQTQLVNTNKLIKYYDNTTGLKTGTTDDAGFCVSATAKRGDMELIAVVLGGQTGDLRFKDAKALLNYGFANYTVMTPDLSSLTLDSVAVKKGTEKSVEVYYEQPKALLLKRGTEQNITLKTTLPESVVAPVTSGQTVGKVAFLLDGEVIGECRLLVKNSVEKMTFKKTFWLILENLF